MKECGGNPRALLETPATTDSEQRSGAHPLPSPIPDSPSYRARSVDRSKIFPIPLATLLLGMAVAGTQTLRVIVRTSRRRPT